MHPWISAKNVSLKSTEKTLLTSYPNLIKRKDEERSDYYSHFTSYKFGDYKNYDACFNSAIGIDNVVDLIEYMVKKG